MKLILVQGVYLSFGYGIRPEQLKSDAVQLAVVCAVFAAIYFPFRAYIRAQRR